MACKTSSVGTKFYYDADGSGSYTELASVKSIEGPDITVETHEHSELGSSGGWKEYCAGFKDGGEVTVNAYFVKTNLTLALDTLLGVVYYYSIKLPLIGAEATNSEVKWQGILVGIGVSVPEDDAVMIPLRIKVTGAVTFVAGA